MADSQQSTTTPKEKAAAKRARLMMEFSQNCEVYPTYTQAAKMTGISARCATRWQSNPQYKAIAQELNRPTNTAIVSRARAMVVPALIRCEKIISNPATKDRDALKALELFSRINLVYSDRDELIATIDELRAQLAESEDCE